MRLPPRQQTANSVHACVLSWIRYIAILMGVFSLAGQADLLAQSRGRNRVYYPLDHRTPPGTAAEWSARLSRSRAGYSQPVQVVLPGEGRVTWFDGGPARPIPMPSPAQAGLLVGHSYRLRISHMPGLPGVELYPSIEVLDRLHPPEGMKHDYPIPIYFTREEMNMALRGNLVTRVIYLEQPQFAIPRSLDEESRLTTLNPNLNLIAEADKLGRPMLIIRLGGRLPDSTGNDVKFYGTGARVTASAPRPQPTEPGAVK